jgi:hypothetical protein
MRSLLPLGLQRLAAHPLGDRIIAKAGRDEPVSVGRQPQSSGRTARSGYGLIAFNAGIQSNPRSAITDLRFQKSQLAVPLPDEEPVCPCCPATLHFPLLRPRRTALREKFVSGKTEPEPDYERYDRHRNELHELPPRSALCSSRSFLRQSERHVCFTPKIEVAKHS